MLSTSSYAHAACKPQFLRISAPFFLLVEGSVPAQKDFWACAAMLKIRGKRRRQAGSRWPDLRKDLLGEEFISAASRWPGRDTIHWGINCWDIFAQLQVSLDPCLETTALCFSCGTMKFSPGELSTWCPNRPFDGGDKAQHTGSMYQPPFQQHVLLLLWCLKGCCNYWLGLQQ